MMQVPLATINPYLFFFKFDNDPRRNFITFLVGDVVSSIVRYCTGAARKTWLCQVFCLKQPKN